MRCEVSIFPDVIQFELAMPANTRQLDLIWCAGAGQGWPVVERAGLARADCDGVSRL